MKTIVVVLVALFTLSCSKEETTNPSQSSSSTTVINTWAKFTVITSAGVTKPNYIVMMFDQPFSTNAPMPTIIKQVTTDANGLAYFDLNTLITSTTPKKYYFEAFVQSGTSYVLKTNFSRYSSDLSKGQMLTTSLLVN